MSVEWTDTFSEGFDAWCADFEAAMTPAMRVGGEYLKAKSAERAPVESGHLRGSGEVTTSGGGFDTRCRLRYPGPYARRQEFELTWRHPRGGQALYLTTTLKVDGGEAIRAVAEFLKGVL